MNDCDFTPEEQGHIDALKHRLATLEAGQHSRHRREAAALRWVLTEVLGVDLRPPPGAPEVYVRPRAA